MCIFPLYSCRFTSFSKSPRRTMFPRKTSSVTSTGAARDNDGYVVEWADIHRMLTCMAAYMHIYTAYMHIYTRADVRNCLNVQAVYGQGVAVHRIQEIRVGKGTALLGMRSPLIEGLTSENCFSVISRRSPKPSSSSSSSSTYTDGENTRTFDFHCSCPYVPSAFLFGLHALMTGKGGDFVRSRLNKRRKSVQARV